MLEWTDAPALSSIAFPLGTWTIALQKAFFIGARDKAPWKKFPTGRTAGRESLLHRVRAGLVGRGRRCGVFLRVPIQTVGLQQRFELLKNLDVVHVHEGDMRGSRKHRTHHEHL